MLQIKLTISFCILLIGEIAFGQNYEIYVSDVIGHKIIRYDQYGGSPTIFIQPGAGGLQRPQDLIFLENDSIAIVSGFLNDEVKKYHSRTGQYMGTWANATRPTRMAIGPGDSLIYVLQWAGSGKVLRFKLDGTFVDEFTTHGIPTSIGLAWDQLNNLYVSSYNANKIHKFDLLGNYLGVFADSNVVGPTNIWFENNGNLLVANFTGNNITRYDSLGNFLSIYSQGYNSPEGFAYLPNENLLIGDRGSGAIKNVNSANGLISNDFVMSGGILIKPNAIILRNVQTVSINEVDNKSNFVINSSGSKFYLNPKANTEIKTITVFDTTGNVVHSSTSMKNKLLWNAGKANNGIYIISITTNDHMSLKQKIMVQK